MGGELVDLISSDTQSLLSKASRLPSVQLSERSTCDLELLATGAFSPLDRFLGKDDYQRVLGEMRLRDGSVFSIPVTLPVDPGPEVRLDQEVALRDSRNDVLALMTIEEVYEWDLTEAATNVFSTIDPRHPLVAEMHRWGAGQHLGAFVGDSASSSWGLPEPSPHP
jgi:sulfate adenylyltransferase